MGNEALSESAKAGEAGLTEVSFAVYELLARSSGDGVKPTTPGDFVHEERPSYQTSFGEGLKSLALGVEDIIQHHRSMVDWHLRDDVQRTMRRDAKRELRRVGSLSEAELDDLARSMVEIARRRPVR